MKTVKLLLLLYPTGHGTKATSPPLVVPPTITSAANGNLLANASNTIQLTATGDPVITWASPDITAGLDISSSGLLTIPTPPQSTGPTSFHVVASNAGGSDSQTYHMYVSGNPTITSSPFGSMLDDGSETIFLTADGLPGTTLDSPDITPGLQLDGDGTLWIPSPPQTDDTTSFEVDATNLYGSDSQTYTLEVHP